MVSMPHRGRPRTLYPCVVLPALLALSSSAPHAQEAAGAALGKRIFTTEAEPQCALCHALADAGATGTIGPNLDDLKPTEDQVRAAVSSGIGVMPAYESLTDEQVAAVASYVAMAVGQAE
jgi:cytochrome c6